MPSCKDMMELIRQGKSPEEIRETLNVRPSRIRRMLNSKRLNKQLDLERDISRKLAARDLGRGVHEMVRRCRELAQGVSNETARKAAEGLLERARRNADQAATRELLAGLGRGW